MARFRSYRPPSENPKCQCWPDMMRAFLCTTGHMLECHYPLSCDEAKCSHLPRYLDPLNLGQDELMARPDRCRECGALKLDDELCPSCGV